jgi:hypothetical protein
MRSNICFLVLCASGSLICTFATAQGIGAGPAAAPSELRSVPAESTIAAVTDSDWTVPRTSWGAPALAGVWSVDDMRGIPRERPQDLGDRVSLTEEEFFDRASRDQGGRNRAESEETFLRNEWGIRTFGFTSLVIDPPNGRIPELTAAGKARAAERRGGTFGAGPFNEFTDFSLYDRCITRGIFGSVLPSIYGNGIVIGQGPDTVSITYEMIHDTRIIKIGDAPTLDDDLDQYMGSSRGYWDGDTLVVEATHFMDNVTGVGGRVSHSDQLKLIERYTRVDPDMIEYVVTVEDPIMYTAPFTYRIMFTTQPNYQVYEYSCHEGNGAVGHSLSGERAYERQVQEAIANGQPVPPRANGMNIYRAPGEEAEIFDINAGE